MFALKIHSVDTDRPVTAQQDFTLVAPNSVHEASVSILERRGIVHLFRGISRHSATSLPSASRSSAILYVVAVPNYLSSEEFLLFCGSHLENVSEILFVRNDAMEDRYAVIVKLKDHISANEFRCRVDGKRFSPVEAELCHILSIISVEYTDSAVIAATPPSGFTELPTCPVCLERLDQDTSGILITLCDHSFQCSCISRWTYLSCQVCRLCRKNDENPTCAACGTTENLWDCLTCGFVGCGRYKEGHAIRHWKDTEHCYSLDLETQRIWDYVGDTYVHRLNQSRIDCGSMANSHCFSKKGECRPCGCGKHSGLSGEFYNSKVEVIFDEYNRLLATQLEAQRQYYESMLLDVRTSKESSISEAVEKAVTLKMIDIQAELEKSMEEKETVAKVNEELLKEDQAWRERAGEAEEREASSLRLKAERVTDLEEQIRDLTVYIKAQKTLDKMKDCDGIKGGTLLPVPSKPSPSSGKHKARMNRRK